MMFDVTQFGAKGDGATDDTLAVNAAFVACNTSPLGGTVYFPAGVYVISDTLTCSGKPISMLGEGQGITRLKWTKPCDGIRFSGSGHRGSELTSFSIQRMSLLAAVPNAGTALNVEWVATPNNYLPKWRINDVEIRAWEQPEETNQITSWWSQGMSITNCGGLHLRNVEIMGNPFGSGGQGIALIAGSSGVFRHFLSGVHVRFFNVGILCTGHVEGIYMDDFELVGCVHGFQSTDSFFVVHLTNGHMDCRDVGALFQNGSTVKLSNIAFIHTGQNPPRTSANIAQFSQCQEVTVIGCSFLGFWPDPRFNDIAHQNGVVLTDCDGGLVVGNHFRFIRDIAMIFGNGCQRCHSVGNRADFVGKRILEPLPPQCTDDNTGV
jgi:hypothetical protein